MEKHPLTHVVTREEATTTARYNDYKLTAFAKFFKGWRFNLALGGTVTALAAVINIAVLAWAVNTFVQDENEGELFTLFNGSCSKSRDVQRWSHWGINILATVMLAASNSCIQCLSSPSREEVEKSRRGPLRIPAVEVGLPSFTNWLHISRIRLLLCVVLALSSAPIHLLYNSAIFEQKSANDYVAIIAAENFFDGPFYDPSSTYPLWAAFGRLQKSRSSLTRVEIPECMRRCSKLYAEDFTGVVVMTDTTNLTDAVLKAHEHQTSNVQSTFWAANVNLNDPSQWPGQYCLIEETQEDCKVLLHRGLLAGVIVCSVIKALCIFATLVIRNFKPLITTGDAIASFLEQPDHTIPDQAPISSIQAKQPVIFKRQVWTGARYRYFRAAGLWRWALTVLCCTIAILVPLILLVHYRNGTEGELLKYNIYSYRDPGPLDFSRLGQLDLNYIVRLYAPHPTTSGDSTYDKEYFLPIANALILSNLPQLLLSALYLLYNALWTRIFAAREPASSHLSHCKPLRLSSPTPGARSTHHLNLPLRFAFPLLISSAALHWLVSQSIFPARLALHGPDLRRYSVSSPSTDQRSFSTVGWSPAALVLALTLGALMTAALLLVAGLARFSGAMPLLAGSPRAIAAACRAEPDGAAAVRGGLAYGVLTEDDARLELRVRRRVGFSAGRVAPLVVGAIYGAEEVEE